MMTEDRQTPMVQAQGLRKEYGVTQAVKDISFEVSRGEVVGFKEEQVLLMPLGPMTGIKPGSKVYATGKPLSVKVGPRLLGRVLNGLGEPMDKKGPLDFEEEYAVDRDPPDSYFRPRIKKVLQM